MIKFIKLSDVDQFTIEKVEPPVYKMWHAEERKMLTANTYMEGYKRKHPVITDKGKLDLNDYQISQILLACHSNGSSNIIGSTIQVKTNGKSGMEIRYFFNLVQ